MKINKITDGSMMFGKAVLFFCLILPFLNGCKSSEPVNMHELLQLTRSGKVYTSYNVWYEDPMDISSLNYLTGKILPFGSEVKDISAIDYLVSFTDVASGQKFQIRYFKNKQMIPFEKYLRRLFTTEYPSSSETGITTSFYNLVKAGKVEEGMTKKEVLVAYGYPSAHRTPYMKGNTWIYYIKPMFSKRLIFKGNKVVGMIQL